MVDIRKECEVVERSKVKVKGVGWLMFVLGFFHYSYRKTD